MVEIIDAQLEFRNDLIKRDLSDVDLIVLHHSGSAMDRTTIHDIHRWHLQRGWLGCGYHYVIHEDGSIFEGRPANAVGAHARGHNERSIGVCVVGNFEEEHPSLRQQEAAGKLIFYLRNKLGNLEIKNHNQVAATLCPGRNFLYLTPEKVNWTREIYKVERIDRIEKLIQEIIYNLQQIKNILKRS